MFFDLSANFASLQFWPMLGLSVVSWVWSAIIIIIQILGIVFALHAVMNSRTPQAAIGWAVSLVFVPWISIPFYLVFGQSKFSGYDLAGHGVVPELDELKHRVKVAMEPFRCQFRAAYQDLTRLCERVSGLPTTTGNQLELLVDGDQTFDTIFADIARAQKWLVAQFYIIRDDKVGKEFQQALLAARRRGVRVLLLYDSVGSKHLPQGYLRKLMDAGVEVESFVTNRKLGVRFQVNFRNHRKLVIVDGKVAYLGGLNVGDEYLGRDRRFGPWRDTHLQVKGPAILPLFLAFCEDWNYAAGQVPGIDLPQVSNEGRIQALSFASGPADELEICPVIYLGAIREARRRIWIASPYFVPDTATRIALQHAALRGVDVRVLLPGKPDHQLPWWTSYSYYPALRQAGVRVFRMREGFMHQKVLLVDNDLAMVGSINFDHRSFFLNFEHAVLACDEGFALAVHQMLERDFASSQEEDLSLFERADFWFRLRVRLASLTAPEQ